MSTYPCPILKLFGHVGQTQTPLRMSHFENSGLLSPPPFFWSVPLSGLCHHPLFALVSVTFQQRLLFSLVSTTAAPASPHPCCSSWLPSTTAASPSMCMYISSWDRQPTSHFVSIPNVTSNAHVLKCTYTLDKGNKAHSQLIAGGIREKLRYRGTCAPFDGPNGAASKPPEVGKKHKAQFN